jgi:ABC-type Fe3+-siderophore transport system permease subunit
MTAPPAGRTGALSGFAFIVLLFASEVAVSLPDLDASDQHVADFYAGHRAAVIVVQVLGFVAAALLVLFALRLRTVDRASGYALLGVAVVALLPGLVTVALAVAADPEHTGTAGWLNDAVGIADDLLFLAIGGFAATVWAARDAYRPGLRWFAAAVSLACFARGVLGFVELEGWLDVVAPFAFLALVAALSVRLLRPSRPVRLAPNG